MYTVQETLALPTFSYLNLRRLPRYTLVPVLGPSLIIVGFHISWLRMPVQD